ncbi:uncharacterized protein ARMOST_22526 [Armillaria ostoyae]|uniref:Chromo domain-containing protein n=1 Tax=Armillaria ostoyae TaxID=47428 RepID=A0A284SD32_ARMOS|nr:uncharacterized protein ARMOST_22526 [Armillaria ostoyae]
MILYGCNPQIIPDSPRPANSKVPAASDFSKAMAKIHKETETALEEATGQMKWELEEVLDSKMRKIRSKRGQPATTVVDYFVKWKGWTREHNSWVAESDMGNTEEAIANYEKKVAIRNKTVARLHLGKITTPKSHSPLAFFIDHKYKNGDFLYLAQ